MEFSLLREVNKKNLSSYVQDRVFKAQYWPTFFPAKTTSFLSYETLIGSKGAPVAADVVAYDSSAPEKMRAIIGKLTGEIPAIRVKRTMTETNLNTYNQLKAMASPDQSQIMDLVFNDVDFVTEAVNARLEWLALTALSFGAITLTKANNAGIITEAAIDFRVPAANKFGAAVIWSAAVATTTPITDFETAQAMAFLLGVKLNYAFMNRTQFGQFRNSAETQNFVRPYTLAGVNKVMRAPSLSTANEALVDNDLPQIVIIDQAITVENEAHVQTTANPWTAGYVTFTADLKVGDTLFAPTAEELNPPKQVVQTKAGNILISKYSDVDPVAEYTKGEANAFPTMPTANLIIMMNALHAATWS
jgi:hypothetical protein